MEEENIPRKRLANVCEDQGVHVIALRMLFSIADSHLGEQRTVAESIRLIRAFQEHIDLRCEALDLLAWQILQLREAVQRQHALLREWPAPLEDSREETYALASSPKPQQAE